MIRSLVSLTKTLSNLGFPRSTLLLQNGIGPQRNLVSSSYQRYFSFLQPQADALLFNNSALNPVNNTNSRTITKYSVSKGKRKSNKAVVKRFYRLHWGMWIRRIAGCHKKLWKKSPPRKRRLRQHVFCNATQSRLLDKMVNNFWRRPKYYVNDPYEPYHTREEFQFTYRKPRPYFPPEQAEN